MTLSIQLCTLMVASQAATGIAAPLNRAIAAGDRQLSVLGAQGSVLKTTSDLTVSTAPSPAPGPGPALGPAPYAPSAAGPAPSPMPVEWYDEQDVENGVEFIFKINGLSYSKLKANVTLWDAVVDTIQKLTVKMIGHNYVHAKHVHVEFSRGFLVAHVRVIPHPSMSAEAMLPSIEASIPNFLLELERQLGAIAGIESAKTADIAVKLVAGPKVMQRKLTREAAPQPAPAPAYAPQPTPKPTHLEPCKEPAPASAPGFGCPGLQPKSSSATLVVNTMLVGLSAVQMVINDMNR